MPLQTNVFSFSLVFTAALLCTFVTPCKGMDQLKGEEVQKCLGMLEESSAQMRGEVLEKSWLALNRLEKAAVIENIAVLEGEILTADEVLYLSTAETSEVYEPKNDMVRCTAALLVHNLKDIWGKLPEEEKDEILFEIAASL